VEDVHELDENEVWEQQSRKLPSDAKASGTERNDFDSEEKEWSTFCVRYVM
jgi:hypothetical protein